MAGLGLGLISFVSVFVILPFAAGTIFLLLMPVAILNGIIGYVGGRRRSVWIPILGPTLLIVASQTWNAMNNPYGWPRSGPPGYYFEWWGLAILIPGVFVSYASSFLMCAVSIRNPKPGLRCVTCEYLLIGLREARCPECGTGFDAGLLGSDQTREDAG